MFFILAIMIVHEEGGVKYLLRPGQMTKYTHESEEKKNMDFLDA